MPLIESREDGYWTECRDRAMGSTAHVVLGDAPAGLASWALDEIERLEQCWSRFRADSELEALHARAGEWVAVSPAMLLALTCADDLNRSTGGLFDPTIRDALERAGYDRTFEDVGRDVGALAPCNPAAGYQRIEIDVDDALVRVPVGVTVDLGGIGKGLAADLVTRGLIDRGARSALVSLGGDMRARGDLPDGAWQIPVEHPLDTALVAFVRPLRNAALVSSTRRFRSWSRAGRAFHHIMDPRTGDSSRTTVVAVVAEASEAWWAEGVAKSIVIAGVDDGTALARACGVRAWMFLDDGQMIDVVP